MRSTKKTSFKNILDSLVDDDGLKTEVTVTLTDKTLIRTSMYLLGTIIAGSVAFFVIRGVMGQQ
ncbi:MAG: hypothetical protein R8G66_06070 [Cytophagales bacterium]|nr:hypothetical protein [Cytophagales bacterium]